MFCKEIVEFHVHHEKMKINDETNAANVSSWHSEHAKKLKLMNCHYKGFFFFLKKSLSLHILKLRVPENHEVPCRFCC